MWILGGWRDRGKPEDTEGRELAGELLEGMMRKKDTERAGGREQRDEAEGAHKSAEESPGGWMPRAQWDALVRGQDAEHGEVAAVRAEAPGRRARC